MSSSDNGPMATIWSRQTNDNAGDRGLSSCLVQISPPDEIPRPIELSVPVHSIGRSSDCHLVLDDPSISRRHAEIWHLRDQFEVRDLGSTNGTYVNDQLVSTRQLSAGDNVRIGNYLFTYLSADDTKSQYRATVYSLMTRDGLTGTINQRFFNELLLRDVSRSSRNSFPLTLVIFDLDHLRTINNQHGVMIGDEVLRQVAQRVQHVLRVEDLLSRYDGDRFAIGLLQTPLAAGTALAERIRASIADVPFATKAGALRATVSMGVAELAELATCTPANLLDLASERHYMAKRSGRNQIRP